ncbi:hypothetical protein LEP1GSC202_3729 [Leptospira yanagawae serovar Saopaulo str. Sao Paulo = ATCC 700523]|uniref:Dolichyl-phosphate-mannose-protein mannosyltransferase n=1 Tax=Leptospira yanagawae serovar Saopaulo str. Sao Paulo = ATCC 700523 TaxID=1249483 RepID=A0A5E8HIH7_9LEPT|nr:hypothetical protein [Leptospira yanagawae]EOQ90523.1 hypothetical protein LEP1GSC202_3729 [Leptospira yanagawae serovar Saopaulo str. Sao Paulo = ATCC 700523]
MNTNSKKSITLILFFIFIVGIQLSVQMSSRFAFGADGYYYAAQVNSYITKGRFFSPDSSPILYGLVAFSKFGSDIVLTNKIFVSILVGSLFLVATRLAYHLTNQFVLSICFGVLFVSSSYIPHFSFNFIKNLGGLFFFILFLTELFTFDPLDTKRKWKQYLRIFVFFVLVFFSHKITAGIAICFLIPWILKQIHWNQYLSFFLAFGTLVTIIGFSFLFPNTLHWNDLKVVIGENLEFQFLSPFYQYSKLYPEFLIEQFLFFLSPICYLINRNDLNQKQKTFYDQMLVLYIFLSLPIFSYTAFSFPFRIFLLIFIPGCFLYLPFVSKIQSQWKLSFLCLLLFPYQIYTMVRGKEFNNQDYKLYSIILPLFQFPKNTLIIVHQGFDYFICFNKAGDAFHFLPEEKHKDRPIYRIAYGVSATEYNLYLPKERKIQYLPGFYSVLEEKTWQEFLQNLPDDSKDRILDWRNPNKHRTETMLRNETFKAKNNSI